MHWSGEKKAAATLRAIFQNTYFCKKIYHGRPQRQEEGSENKNLGTYEGWSCSIYET